MCAVVELYSSEDEEPCILDKDSPDNSVLVTGKISSSFVHGMKDDSAYLTMTQTEVFDFSSTEEVIKVDTKVAHSIKTPVYSSSSDEEDGVLDTMTQTEVFDFSSTEEVLKVDIKVAHSIKTPVYSSSSDEEDEVLDFSPFKNGKGVIIKNNDEDTMEYLNTSSIRFNGKFDNYNNGYGDREALEIGMKASVNYGAAAANNSAEKRSQRNSEFCLTHVARGKRHAHLVTAPSVKAFVKLLQKEHMNVNQSDFEKHLHCSLCKEENQGEFNRIVRFINKVQEALRVGLAKNGMNSMPVSFNQRYHLLVQACAIFLIPDALQKTPDGNVDPSWLKNHLPGCGHATAADLSDILDAQRFSINKEPPQLESFLSKKRNRRDDNVDEVIVKWISLQRFLKPI